MLPITNTLADEGKGKNVCPVGLVTGLTLDEEFGAGSSGITHCLEKRKKVKLVVQANQFCMDNVSNAECTRPYALRNLTKMIDDYEITHGMKPGRDYEMAVIAHTAGGPLMLKDESLNQFRNDVETLIGQGVKFYLCQNATRAMISRGLLPAGDATANIIDGVEYVTAGITAVIDFQYQGYVYVQP
jgi:intracellular sulfur oxidation DsrE/DsrF family protein